MTHVRNQDFTVQGEFTSDSMWLELSIDLDDLLRDGGVLGIDKWDADGSFIYQMTHAQRSVSDLTFYANRRGCGTWLMRSTLSDSASASASASANAYRRTGERWVYVYVCAL